MALFISLLSSQLIISQNPSNLKWENRIVIVFTNSENSEKFLAQKNELIPEIKGFEERKLKLIHSTPEKFMQSLPIASEWIEDAGIYKQMLDKEADFEVILIGLDGGIKLRQKEILESNHLFSLIDSMPMRQAEMRKKT